MANGNIEIVIKCEIDEDLLSSMVMDAIQEAIDNKDFILIKPKDDNTDG